MSNVELAPNLDAKHTIEQKVHSATEALDRLRIPGTGLYMAAYVGHKSDGYDIESDGYPHNFTRDSIKYCFLADDQGALLEQAAYSAQRLGKTPDPRTGEEPGKPHHEMYHELASVEMNGYSTAYNACDTAALLLLGIERLSRDENEYVTGRFRQAIAECADYIVRHTDENDRLFYEDPKYSGADRYGLDVTYWKDSKLNNVRKEPVYPIVYTLAHFQNAAGLRAAGKLLEEQELLDTADEMFQAGFDKLWAGDHFITALDGDGLRIDPPSSDSLHALYYISPEDLPNSYAGAIEDYMRTLETPFGYRSGLPATNDEDIDDYHFQVWTHEQAFLHAAAKSHGLIGASQVTSRVYTGGHLESFPEILNPDTGKPVNNRLQLWAVGAHIYFANQTPTGDYRTNLSHAALKQR